MFFDKTGKQIDEKDALDANGVIRDGVRTRVSLMDAQSTRQSPRRSTRPRVTDNSGGIEGLSRPGFRVAAKGVLSTDAVAARDAAYQEYEHSLCDAWRSR